MSLNCAISGEIPQEPVVSAVSGHIFEKRLILKYISENGTDPINNETLTPEQLVDIKTSEIATPRITQGLSIPQLLKMMQDEWDALVLSSYKTRQQLNTARQELSHALYQHDAALRVISRLDRDSTVAREALASLRAHAPAQSTHADHGFDHEMEPSAEDVGEIVGMTDDIVKKLEDHGHKLTQSRKQRGKHLPQSLASKDNINQYKQVASETGLHSAGSPAIFGMDIQHSNDKMIVTGGADKKVVVYDREAKKIQAAFEGHSKRVNKVVYHKQEPVVLSCSNDGTLRVWSVKGNKSLVVIKAHQGPATDLSLHATGDYVLSGGKDAKWAFHDLRTGRTIVEAEDTDKSPITRAAFHPDGLILGTGNEGSVVKIWDVKDQSCVCQFTGHTGPIGSLAFSENGYYLATGGGDDSCIKLWDLRKLVNFHTIKLDDQEGSYQVNDLAFDYSGQYLACAGNDVRVYMAKQWSTLFTAYNHQDGATSVRFGDDAKFVASVGMDRALRFYAE